MGDPSAPTVPLTGALAILLAMFALPAFSQSTTPSTTPATQPAETDGKTSTTHHQITLDGKALAYRATAGNLPMKDEAGKPKADIFFVAYETENAADAKSTDTRPDPATRPIMFLFNGGPGAAAVWLHLGAAGPRSIALGDGDVPTGPPYKLADNPAAWLGATDLVFVDPVSTGYSRPAPGEKADQFHGVQNDIESVGEFVRVYLTRYRRWASPVYLAGESYGTTRAAALVDFLAERYGIAASGVVLISSVLDFQALAANKGNDLPYQMFLPSYTAVAWYHKKLSPDLQADFDRTIDRARRFTLDEYGPALQQGAALSPEKRAAIVKQLAAFTGLPAELVDRSNLRIDADLFQKRLLGDGRQIVGRFDGRITGYDTDAISNHPSYDPSLSRYLAAYSSTFNDYIRRVLKYESDLPYEVLKNVQPWSFGRDGEGYLYVLDKLQFAMVKNPKLRVLFVSGHYDLATPFFASDYAIDRMRLSDDLRANVTQAYYPAGHMMYHNRPAAQKLAEDIAKFVTKPQ